MAAKLQVWDVKEPYLNLHCQLGEGPFYEKATHCLRFVDIHKRQLHTVDLAAGPSSLQTLNVDCPISVTADIRGVDPRDRIAVGLKYGFAILDRRTGKYEYVRRFSQDDTPAANVSISVSANGNGTQAKPIVDYERVRSNDGAADPHGRFWLGSMTDFDLGPFQAEGGLFRFDGRESGEAVLLGLTIPNSVGWSPDGCTMYFTDTTANVVYAFDYGAVDGRLSNKRIIYRHERPGSVDGFRVDSEGNLWHAVYGGACVIKISPKDGSILGEIRLPTANITCPQFVGTELFITTADDEEGTNGPQSKELGGAVFRVDVGVTGLPLYESGLEVR